MKISDVHTQSMEEIHLEKHIDVWDLINCRYCIKDDLLRLRRDISKLEEEFIKKGT